MVTQLQLTNHHQTVEEETLVSALQGKFKLMLGQLLHHVRPLSLPGDKLPDQEIFLIGLHGSKLHLMRAFFPGQKISSLWCRRELTSSNPSSPIIMMQGPSHQSPETSCSTHIEDYDPENGTGDSQEDSSEDGQGSQSRSNSNRFYAAENIERLRQRLQATQLQRLDHESDLRTFRVLATREYDLWLKDDFTAAVHILVALHTYLLSGKAQCGALQETFIKHPYVGDGYESDSPAESGEELDSRLRDDERKEQMEIEEKEEELRREELIRREEDAAASRVRESMRNSHRDSISSLRDARRRWWDFVWGDSEESLLQKGRGDGNGDGDGDEEGEMIVGNLDT